MGKLSLQFFCDPKKETDKVRVIFNLKHLNEAVTYRKFKMDTLESAIKLMKPGCFMTSIDLRDAYYRVYQKKLNRFEIALSFGKQLLVSSF